ncbi:hypothetical protein ECANGB1_1345 [Enterospora canceri]|uniref:Uncharacterized protein n=1 Tax=Enterospora canceri TaxID=1081671 RepID=A0A1Y1S6A4_9MICR|nr:hypothetical protein ECANGB1_1345 [Enterospora canceri]
MDAESILGRIEHKHRLFNSKSLRFDRHGLSESEEKKFNKKIRKFLNEMHKKMEDEDIDYVLEYLVRIYSIDTFNTEELLLLLLPYERYADQIGILTHNQNVEIKEYNWNQITRYFTQSNRHFDTFVAYFDHYNEISSFLNSLLLKIATTIKHTKTDYLDEFLTIFKKLHQNNQNDLIWEIYDEMQGYFNSDEFKTVLSELMNKSL